MSEKFTTLKKKVGGITKRLLSHFTPTQAGWGSIIFCLVILLLFLCTVTGRNIIVFCGYVGFIGILLYLSYELYKYCTMHATAKPKEKPIPEPVTEVEEDEAEEPHQITFDEVVGETEDAPKEE